MFFLKFASYVKKKTIRRSLLFRGKWLFTKKKRLDMRKEIFIIIESMCIRALGRPVNVKQPLLMLSSDTNRKLTSLWRDQYFVRSWDMKFFLACRLSLMWLVACAVHYRTWIVQIVWQYKALSRLFAHSYPCMINYPTAPPPSSVNKTNGRFLSLCYWK